MALVLERADRSPALSVLSFFLPDRFRKGSEAGPLSGLNRDGASRHPQQGLSLPPLPAASGLSQRQSAAMSPGSKSCTPPQALHVSVQAP